MWHSDSYFFMLFLEQNCTSSKRYNRLKSSMQPTALYHQKSAVFPCETPLVPNPNGILREQSLGRHLSQSKDTIQFLV